ncbi:pol, partial [Mucuna pruriens]
MPLKHNSTLANYTTTKKELLDIVFALDKFQSYLLGFKIIIRDKNGAKDLVADHMSRIERRIDPLLIRDDFPNEQLMQLDGITPWFAYIVNYLVASILPIKGSKSYKDKVSIMHCIGQPERYWIVGFISPPFSRMPTKSLPPMSSVKEKEWPSPVNDFMGPFLVSYGYGYILLIIDYVSKWVEAKVTKTNDAKVVADLGSHFCNKTMFTLLEKYGVVHRVATAYHPQTNRQAKVFNRDIKQILQKVVHPYRKDWSRLLEDAL